MLDWDALVLAPCNAAFAEDGRVYYYPGAGPVMTLTGQGIFADRFRESTFHDATEIESVRTVINVRAALFAATPVKGELFRVRGVLYVINEVQPDGMGDIRLYLGFASDAEAARVPFPP